MADPYGKGPRNPEILKKIGIGEGKLPNVEFKRRNPDTGKMETLGATEIGDVLKEEKEGRLIRKTSKMFKGGILNRTYGMKEGGFTKRGGMYKKGY
jgi:hypothetical protein